MDGAVQGFCFSNPIIWTEFAQCHCASNQIGPILFRHRPQG